MAELSSPLNSTWLKYASYDTDTRELKISMASGQSYNFQDVPQEIYEGLAAAPSAGQYYHQNIKGNYG